MEIPEIFIGVQKVNRGHGRSQTETLITTAYWNQDFFFLFLLARSVGPNQDTKSHLHEFSHIIEKLTEPSMYRTVEPLAVYSKRNNKPAANHAQISRRCFSVCPYNISFLHSFLLFIRSPHIVRLSHGVHYTSHSIGRRVLYKFHVLPACTRTSHTDIHTHTHAHEMWQLFLLRSFIMRAYCSTYFSLHVVEIYVSRTAATTITWVLPLMWLCKSMVAARVCVCASVPILLHQANGTMTWTLNVRCGNRHKRRHTVESTANGEKGFATFVFAFLSRCPTTVLSTLYTRERSVCVFPFHSVHFFSSTRIVVVALQSVARARLYLANDCECELGTHTMYIRVPSCALCKCYTCSMAWKAIKFYGHKTFNGYHGYTWP